MAAKIVWGYAKLPHSPNKKVNSLNKLFECRVTYTTFLACFSSTSTKML